jgi:hypothetical protein
MSWKRRNGWKQATHATRCAHCRKHVRRGDRVYQRDGQVYCCTVPVKTQRVADESVVLA